MTSKAWRVRVALQACSNRGRRASRPATGAPPPEGPSPARAPQATWKPSPSLAPICRSVTHTGLAAPLFPESGCVSFFFQGVVKVCPSLDRLHHFPPKSSRVSLFFQGEGKVCHPLDWLHHFPTGAVLLSRSCEQKLDQVPDILCLVHHPGGHGCKAA